MNPDNITDGSMVVVNAINIDMRWVAAMVEIKSPNAKALKR